MGFCILPTYYTLKYPRLAFQSSYTTDASFPSHADGIPKLCFFLLYDVPDPPPGMFPPVIRSPWHFQRGVFLSSYEITLPPPPPPPLRSFNPLRAAQMPSSPIISQLSIFHSSFNFTILLFFSLLQFFNNFSKFLFYFPFISGKLVNFLQQKGLVEFLNLYFTIIYWRNNISIQQSKDDINFSIFFF